jgi:hypothetical protein
MDPLLKALWIIRDVKTSGFQTRVYNEMAEFARPTAEKLEKCCKIV